MNPISRHKNTIVLTTVLLAQLLALAVQVKRQTAEGPVRIIRLLTVDTIAGFERGMLHTGQSVRGVWTNYVDLRGVRRENLRLQSETQQLRMEHAREQEEIRQAHRIQALLAFKEHWIDTTVAAQVIGTSGTETSRLLYLDKGTKDGVKADMPVITPDGVVGKVLAVYGDTAQVLMMNDVTSGVGAILVKSRLQGIVKGTPTGGAELKFIMGDEPVQAGEAVVTSGGDRVFPKGLPVGTVAKVNMGRNLFLEIEVRPAVDLDRLEEVLVITQQKAREPDTAGLGPIRASDILAEHLPGVPAPAPADPAAAAAGTNKAASATGAAPKAAAPARAAAGATAPAKPASAKPVTAKPASAMPAPAAVAPRTALPKTAPATNPRPAPKAALPGALGAKSGSAKTGAAASKPQAAQGSAKQGPATEGAPTQEPATQGSPQP